MENKIKVEQLANNQFIIYTEDGRYLQSYDSIVAFISKEGIITLGKNWEYSRTTMKYVGQFLGQDTKTTRKDILKNKIKIDENL